DAVVPSLGEVTIVCEKGEVRNRRDGIAGRNSDSTDFGRGPTTGIKRKILLRMDLLRIARSNVCVPDVCDGKNWPFGAKDDPSLIRKSCTQPSTEHLHGDESVGTDATNHSAEFIHMCVEHDTRPGLALLRDDRAETVIEDAVSVRLHALPHNLSNGILVAWRAGNFREFFQKLDDAICGWRFGRPSCLSSGWQHKEHQGDATKRSRHGLWSPEKGEMIVQVVRQDPYFRPQWLPNFSNIRAHC